MIFSILKHLRCITSGHFIPRETLSEGRKLFSLNKCCDLDGSGSQLEDNVGFARSSLKRHQHLMRGSGWAKFADDDQESEFPGR